MGESRHVPAAAEVERDRCSRESHRESAAGAPGSLDRLRRALGADELELHYQPKVHLRTGALHGAEALLRWRHPDHGLLAPGDFLSVCEGTELELELGEWVLRTALAQAAAWAADGRPIQVSINVSARELLDAGFLARLERALAPYGGSGGGRLELEVLETFALSNLARAGAVIEACARHGVPLALDDFGTGYSSLTYLRRLPVGVLKIDQSFVRNMLTGIEDLVIVDGVIALGEAFGRTVVAEGVESAEHALALLQLGCEIGQGHGIAPPMPAAELDDWLLRFSPDPRWLAAARCPPRPLARLRGLFSRPQA